MINAFTDSNGLPLLTLVNLECLEAQIHPVEDKGLLALENIRPNLPLLFLQARQSDPLILRNMIHFDHIAPAGPIVASSS